MNVGNKRMRWNGFKWRVRHEVTRPALDTRVCLAYFVQRADQSKRSSGMVLIFSQFSVREADIDKGDNFVPHITFSRCVEHCCSLKQTRTIQFI